MLRLIVFGHVGVEGRIDRPGTEAVWHRPETELPKLARKREAGKTRRREKHARRGHAPRAEPLDHAYRHKARRDRSGRNDHRHRTDPGNPRAERRRHERPGGSERGVGQAEADEGQVDDGQKSYGHGTSPSFSRSRPALDETRSPTDYHTGAGSISEGAHGHLGRPTAHRFEHPLLPR